ncbi:hypothetical protein [Aquimarina spongiae]|uniref:Uncharacterized protein n=1 Tax=Aquimarina spongiae TaxID=570521 RepID=A0A1M6I1B1_9FLAO|nr:hypothetical protein [Aquimarina spongiae]SHJ28256.1 hypothetical protein SAMN04488508_10753 [Aquimarina spongiae]
MTEETKKEESKKHNGLHWQTEADSELNSSEWIGAILRYFWHLRRKKFDTIYNPKQLKKNAIIGWLFKMTILLTMIYIGYRYMSSI